MFHSGTEMTVFKVWDCKRRIRKSVVASNLDELTAKGTYENFEITFHIE
jgi:hypothetical protein